MITRPVSLMATFYIQTLGCKVNQYESEQIASLLRSRGLVGVDQPEADLRVVNTCSVTIQAASKSRQTVRRTTRLPVLENNASIATLPINWQGRGQASREPSRTIVTGCWATSDRAAAMQLPGVDAVLGHHNDVAAELDRLLDRWNLCSKPSPPSPVKQNPAFGTRSLPLLEEHQSGHQRAFLKVQDGCDAHCSYCIIPRLRPNLWSKPVEKVVDEARRMVDAGHVEIVLTGIFLSAYGHPTALRRRQPRDSEKPLADLLSALCTQVSGLRRLRFSSLEPGDLTSGLLTAMRSHEQIVPHFHLPLQSGSDALLHDFLRMVDQVRDAFDRPAITTDIIVGFPGETDGEFARTVEVADRVKFIHIHAFSFSPRPGTAAARWKADFVHGPVVNERIECLGARAAAHSLEFRRQFVNETVELLVERQRVQSSVRHGRCERYFDVSFEDAVARTGDAVRVTIDAVSPEGTMGHVVAAA